MKEEEKVDEAAFLEGLIQNLEDGIKTIKEHFEKPQIIFPYAVPDGRNLEGLGCICAECGTPLLDLRGKMEMKFQTLEADIYGFCVSCYTVDHHLMRWHKEGHWTCCVKGEWYDIHMVPIRFPRLRRFYKNIISKFRND